MHENGATATARAKPARFRYTTGQIARALNARLVGSPDVEIQRLDAMDHADAATLTFIRDAKRAAGWPRCAAAAAIVSKGVDIADDARPILIVDDADHALIAVLETLTPPTASPERGAHPTAFIDPAASVHESAHIGPGAVVGARSVIGAGATLFANVVVGADVRIGEGAELRAGVVIEDRCVVGARTRIHPNAVIGADGFGYRPDPATRALIKIPHAGNVEIGDDVEIGAGAAIDRGKFGPTVVGSGSKIDNLVQIGHNCRIGRSCIICGCCALAGSVVVGDGAVLAGGVGVADNIEIGAGARVGARSGVMNNIPAGESWVGYPAEPARETLKKVAAVRSLPQALKDLRRVQRKLGLDREQSPSE